MFCDPFLFPCGWLSDFPLGIPFCCKTDWAEFLTTKKCDILQWPSESADLNPVEYVFQLLEKKLNVQRLTNKAAPVKAEHSISREEPQHLMIQYLWALDCKFHPSIKISLYILNDVSLSNDFSAFKRRTMYVIPKYLI